MNVRFCQASAHHFSYFLLILDVFIGGIVYTLYYTNTAFPIFYGLFTCFPLPHSQTNPAIVGFFPRLSLSAILFSNLSIV